MHVACVALDGESFRSARSVSVAPNGSPREASALAYPYQSILLTRHIGTDCALSPLYFYRCNEKRTLFLAHHCTCVFFLPQIHLQRESSVILEAERSILLFWYGNDLHTVHCSLKRTNSFSNLIKCYLKKLIFS